MTTWPDPNAPHADIDDFVREHAYPPQDAPWGYADLGAGAKVLHEAPPMSNGPSVMCSACGLVRIEILGIPFCKTCQSTMAGLF